MLEVRKRYTRALAEYVRGSSSRSLREAAGLGDLFKAYEPEVVLALHEEAVHMLKANAEPEEAIDIVRKAHFFVMVILFSYWTNGGSSDRDMEPSRPIIELLNSIQPNEELVRSKHENLLQHLDSAILLLDAEGFVSFVNLSMARLLGVPRRALLGCDAIEIVKHHELSREKKRMIVRFFKEMKRNRSKYHEMVTYDGRHLLVTVKTDSELDGDCLISVKDLTEYKSIEQSSYQNDKLAMLGKIAAAIAHEIRNPLTSIRGFIQLLRSDLAKLGKEEYARIILSEIDRANEIIHEFLNSSKPSAPVKEEVEVRSLLKEVILLSESEALMHGCQLICEPVASQLIVSIDVKQIKQVLLNMIKNAIDAISEKKEQRNGMITIRAVSEGRFAHICIRDNGKGMSKQTMNRLFDPFFTTKEEGTGLGLSVSYRITRNHGGTIRVESSVDEGTEFDILLPLVGYSNGRPA